MRADKLSCYRATSCFSIIVIMRITKQLASPLRISSQGTSLRWSLNTSQSAFCTSKQYDGKVAHFSLWCIDFSGGIKSITFLSCSGGVRTLNGGTSLIIIVCAILFFNKCCLYSFHHSFRIDILFPSHYYTNLCLIRLHEKIYVCCNSTKFNIDLELFVFCC